MSLRRSHHLFLFFSLSTLRRELKWVHPWIVTVETSFWRVWASVLNIATCQIMYVNVRRHIFCFTDYGDTKPERESNIGCVIPASLVHSVAILAIKHSKISIEFVFCTPILHHYWKNVTSISFKKKKSTILLVYYLENYVHYIFLLHDGIFRKEVDNNTLS